MVKQRGHEVLPEHELDHEPVGQPWDERGDHGRDAVACQQPGQHGEPERAQDVGGEDQVLEIEDVRLETPGELVHGRGIT